MTIPSTHPVVDVTGASAGVGRAVVREFGKRRARVGLLARGTDGLEGARREVEAAGGQAVVPRRGSAWPRPGSWPTAARAGRSMGIEG